MGVSCRSHHSSPETQDRSRRRSTSNQAAVKPERRLFASRESLYRRRLSLKEKRNKIREERIYVAELQAKLFTSISRSLDLGSPIEESLVRKLHTQITAKTDELGALQYDYDQAEEEYDIAEEELNDQEDVERETLEPSSFDVRTQSSHSDCEAGAKESAGFQLSDLEHLQGVQARRSLSSTQINQTRYYRKSSIRKTGQDSVNTLVQSQEVAAEAESIKEDSDHDILEATFFVRFTTTPGEQNGHIVPVVESTAADPTSTKGELVFQEDGRQWESVSHQGFFWGTDTEPSQAVDMDSRSKARSDSGLMAHRKALIRRRSRIIWWLFNTFGSSWVDYLERARNKLQPGAFEKLDDEKWARLVYSHWTRDQLPPGTSDIPGDVKARDTANHGHVEAQSLGGSYLLLPSGQSKVQNSVRNIDRLFSGYSMSPEDLETSRTPNLDDDLSNLLASDGASRL